MKAHSQPGRASSGNQSPGQSTVFNAGSMEQGLASADQKLSQTYTVRYIAHAPLEPRAAVAQWDGDQVTVWMSTQRPFGTRTEIAKAFRLPEDKVRVIVPGVHLLAMAASTPASMASKRPAWRAPRKNP